MGSGVSVGYRGRSRRCGDCAGGRSKADPEGRDAQVYLAPDSMGLVRKWLERSGIGKSRVFRSLCRGIVGEGLGAGEVSRIFKRMARDANLPMEVVEQISGHSTRVGPLHVDLHRSRHVPGDGTVHRNEAGIIRSNEGSGRAKAARLYSSNQRHAHSDSLRPPRRVRREHHPPLAAGPKLIILAGHLAPVHTRRVGDIARRWTSADRTLYVPGGRQGGDASQRAIGRAPAQRRIRPPAQGQTNPRDRAQW